ncbi:MAG: 5-histidylcysteine sulfoxide synthase [Paraglaciecola polaris]|uniref:5-histidylcysteine sulfoxide synthase n=1 Tax=Paraglaciecola polaris TaxID=222814 RepID=UPI0030035C9B|tara:strand:+ start:14061 stop:16229 length:2169 start_codon:yes stop_codon:yes gene_type:complete
MYAQNLKAPNNPALGQLPRLHKPPLLSGASVGGKRAELKRYFLQNWALYESLFDLINDDKAFYLRPEPLRHPLIFYYGHTAVFYVNKLLLGNYIQQRVDNNIESTCAVGVDEMSWDDLSPDNYQWPTVDAVRAYRNKVKTMVSDLIDNMALTLPISQDSPAWIILMGAEHEGIHIETSSVIMRMLDSEYLTDNGQWPSYPTCANDSYERFKNTLKLVPSQHVRLGKPVDNDTYGWDNEYGISNLLVADFHASETLVSNQEFMEFVEAGGYEHLDYWTQEGKEWLMYTKATMPRFWSKLNGQYLQRNLLNYISLPLSWPVEVNYLEAKAFCNWKTTQLPGFVRLPTEAEWQVLRDTLSTDLPLWQEAPGNINLEYYASSCPVDAFSQGAFFDVIGNVWQWTESPIDGFDGFQVHPLYDDFSTPTFDGRHNLIKGGSWISTGNEATRDSRYAFRRHFYQHAGFRYVQSSSESIPLTPVNQYENQTDISRMLHHQYGPKSALFEHDLQQVLALCQSMIDDELCKPNKALDMGCGTGRLAFELSRVFTDVDGIDLTARHIQHCLHLKDHGQLRYALPTEGELQQFIEINRHELGFIHKPENLNFAQGDGHNLKPQFNHYDLIVAHRMLDQLYDPQTFLHTMLARLNPRGILLLTSAYAWNEDITPKSKWLGGVKINGENQTSAAQLKYILGQSCDLLIEDELTSDVQIDNRTSARAHNHLTMWRKR